MEENARHLNFNKFVQERSVEIAKFLTELEMDTKKKGHQALPKSIRRRAMSHNRFRIPRRLRKNMEEQLVKAESMQKIPKCRKHIRKRRHLIMAYKLRNDKNRWLSTHLWAAKRMRMVNYYGFKVAFTPNDKSFRSAYRYSRHSCTLTDLSYYYALALTTDNTQIQQLPSFISLESRGLQVFPSTGKLYNCSIISNNKLVCPGILIRAQQNSSKISIRFFFHPSALEQVKKLSLPIGWSATLEQGQTDLYYLSGPSSVQILQESFKQYGMLANEERIACNLFTKNSQAIYFNMQNDYSIGKKPLVDAPIAQEKLLSEGYNAKSNEALRSRLLDLFTGLRVQKMTTQSSENEVAFWNMYNKGQNSDFAKTVFRITMRSRYTHRRNKLTKQEKREVIKADRESSSEEPRKKRKIKQESEQGQSNSEKQIFVEGNVPKQNATLQVVEPVLVGQDGEGFYLWASNSNSCRLWRILSKLNLKIIGRRQFAHAHLQNSKRLFPEDYPQTTAFLSYCEEQINKNFQKYLRMPLPKRPNYLKLQSPSPLGPIVPNQSFSVEIEMVSRGNCSKYAYICQLLASDLQKISSELQSGHLGIVLTQQGEGERKAYKQLSQMYADLQSVKPSRKIVGSVTSGGYRYTHCKQGGIGFINNSLLTTGYLQKFNGYIFVRKPNSPHYYLAQLVKKFE